MGGDNVRRLRHTRQGRIGAEEGGRGSGGRGWFERGWGLALLLVNKTPKHAKVFENFLHHCIPCLLSLIVPTSSNGN